MRTLIDSLLGDGPYPFSLDRIEDYTKYYESTSLNIIITKMNISFLAGPQIHSHDSYEFLIPFKPMPHIGCEGQSCLLPKNMVFPFNPLQEHGPTGKIANTLFTAIHIESGFMRSVSKSIFGEDNVVFENKPVPVSNELRALIAKFAKEVSKPKIGSDIVTDCLSTQIAIQLIRDFKSSGAANRPLPLAMTNTNLNKVVNTYFQSPASREYSTQAAAKEANLSKYHYIRAFKKETGKTPYRMLVDMKMEKACKLLKESDCSITEIYFLCGFINHSHFTTSFKKKTGMTPSIYRKVNAR